MTKLRAPLSFEDGITRIAGRLGWAKAAEAIGYETSMLRRCSNPDDQRRLHLDDAFKLDHAYRMDGGEGAPLLDAYAHQLDVAERVARGASVELARLVSIIAKEGGEGMEALVRAMMPDATAADRAHALRECQQWDAAVKAVMPALEAPP